MKSGKQVRRPAVYVALGLMLLAGAALAQRGGGRPAGSSDFTRFSITVGGGAGFAEQHPAMTQLLAEVQYSLTARFRLGLGVGYLAAGGHRDHEGDNRIRPMNGDRAAMMLAEWGQYLRSSQELGRDFRLVPISLNVYYVVPVARKWNVTLGGGASYYLGTFYGNAARLSKNAWGGQAGLGLEYRLNPRLKLIAQAAYRFVEFKGLKIPQPLNPLAAAASALGLGNLMNLVAPWLLPKPVDVHLNGLSLTAGVRFGI